MPEISPWLLLAGALLVYVTLERLFELLLSRRHTRALLAEGAYEVGRGHYPFMVGVHVLWLAALWPGGPKPFWAWFYGLQAQLPSLY